MIWEQIQTTKREKKDLHVIWLDLANAYGSVPHLLIAYALEFFYIPDNIRTMIMNYFQDMHMCFALKKVTTGWQQLEIGIAMGCSISLILFVAAFEVILMGQGRWWVGSGCCRSEAPAPKELYGRHHLPATNCPMHIQAA